MLSGGKLLVIATDDEDCAATSPARPFVTGRLFNHLVGAPKIGVLLDCVSDGPALTEYRYWSSGLQKRMRRPALISHCQTMLPLTVIRQPLETSLERQKTALSPFR